MDKKIDKQNLLLLIGEKHNNLMSKVEDFFYNRDVGLVRNIKWILLYRFLLDIIYIKIICPVWGYSATDFFRYSILLPYLNSWLILLLASPAIVYISKKENASSILISMINFIYFIPLSSYVGCKGQVSVGFVAVSIAYWLILLTIQIKLPVLVLQPLKERDNKKAYFMEIITVIACAFILVISWKYTGFRLTVNLLGVYELRSEAAAYEMPKLVRYIMSMLPLVLSITLLYWLREKKWIVSAAVVGCFLLLFSIAGHKSTFFMLALVLGIHFFFKRWMLNILPLLFVILSGAALMENIVFDSYWIISFFVRRMMYVPAALSEAYYNFFLENPLNLFRDGIMGRFSYDGIYMTTIPRIVAESIGEYSMNANNGMLGDMLANLPPLLGVVIMPLILVACFRIFDMTTKNLDLKLLLPFAVYFANTFINSSWSTALLSHGFLLACVILYIFPRNKERKNEKL